MTCGKMTTLYPFDERHPCDEIDIINDNGYRYCRDYGSCDCPLCAVGAECRMTFDELMYSKGCFVN